MKMNNNATLGSAGARRDGDLCENALVPMTQANEHAGLLLEAEGLSRRNERDGGWLFSGLTLGVAPGERLALVGPTGSGKSLLLRALALLDPADEGELRWRGRPVPDARVPAFRHHVIYLHQRPAFREGSVEEVMRFPFSLREHRGARFDRDGTVARLEDLGWGASFLDKPVRYLSGGESQVVALLRAVQLDPEVFLLDEPTAALDAAATDRVERLVGSWLEAGAGERACIWVSHDRGQAARMSDRVLSLRSGRLEGER